MHINTHYKRHKNNYFVLVIHFFKNVFHVSLSKILIAKTRPQSSETSSMADKMSSRSVPLKITQLHRALDDEDRRDQQALEKQDHRETKLKF